MNHLNEPASSLKNIVIQAVIVNAVPAELERRIEEKYGGRLFREYGVGVVLKGNYWNGETSEYDRRYAVMFDGVSYNKELVGSFEVLPSERDGSFIEHYRFAYDEAVEVAFKLSAQLRPLAAMGMNVAELLESLER